MVARPYIFQNSPAERILRETRLSQLTIADEADLGFSGRWTLRVALLAKVPDAILIKQDLSGILHMLWHQLHIACRRIRGLDIMHAAIMGRGSCFVYMAHMADILAKHIIMSGVQVAMRAAHA
jgi:hypothetical protein